MSDSNQVQQQQFWDKEAGKYDLAVKILNSHFLKEIPRLIPSEKLKDKKVLEVACGTGLITQHLATSAELVATDISEAMLSICQQRIAFYENKSEIKFLKAGVYNIPFPDRSFDLVVCGNLLHLLDEPARGLFELKRVLKLSGELIVPTFCHGETPMARAISHVLSWFGFPVITRFKSGTLELLIEACGFEIKEQRILPGPIPVYWLSVAQSLKD